MYYLDADNNLEEVILSDFNEIEMVEIPEWLNVIVLFDRAVGYYAGDGNWTDTRLYRVVHDTNMYALASERLDDPDYLGLSSTTETELNMGAQETVEGFVDFVKATFPSAHYGLFFNDHGDGWSKAMGGDDGPLFKGCCSDDSHGDSLSVQTEIRPAIEGEELDIIGFDACLMGMIEVGWALKDDADIMIASEASEPGDGWDYTNWLSHWIDGEHSAENLGFECVETYGEYYASYGDWWTLTLSAVDLTAFDTIGGAIDGFVDSYSPAPYLGKEFEWMDYYDLFGTAANADYSPLMDAVYDAVINEWHSGSDTIGGISIYYGNNWQYSSIKFCEDTDWC
jgi:hypothetical protein